MSAPEHNFGVERLISGEEIRGYSAASDLTAGEPVGISGDNEVDSSASGEENFVGVVLYDVTSGEEVAIAGDDCEVQIPISESISAGDALVPDGAGEFQQADDTNNGESGVALAQEGGSSSDDIEAYLFAVGGATL
jgi:hypothetical protein